MSYIKTTLASGRWENFDLPEQLANIGSEVERAISWREKGNSDYSQKAFLRSLELLEFTIADPQNKKRLKELTRVRELLLDYFWGNNEYNSSDELWHKYFYPFNHLARINT